MREKCVKNLVVYQATVSTEDHNLPQRTYVRLTENSFKTSYLDQKSSFCNANKRHNTGYIDLVFERKLDII